MYLIQTHADARVKALHDDLYNKYAMNFQFTIAHDPLDLTVQPQPAAALLGTSLYRDHPSPSVFPLPLDMGPYCPTC